MNFTTSNSRSNHGSSNTNTELLHYQHVVERRHLLTITANCKCYQLLTAADW